MADLFQRLKSVLADRYTIERELGPQCVSPVCSESGGLRREGPATRGSKRARMDNG